MNILVHNAVIEEELPAGVCSVFTIFHVAAIDTENSVCGGAVHICSYLRSPTFKQTVAYRVRVSIIEGRLNCLHSLAGFSNAASDPENELPCGTVSP